MLINLPKIYFFSSWLTFLHKKLNDNLYQLSQTLFDSMFPAIAIGDSKVGDYVIPKRGKSLLSKDAVFGEVPVVAGGLEPSTYHNMANTISPVITISASGANAGFVNLWGLPVWSSDSSFIDTSMTDDVYFWYVLLKKRQKEIFDAQTGSAQPHIYPHLIAELPLKNLNADSVKQYTTLVTSFFETIANNKIINTRLASLRDVLLPKLMSGELNVSDIKV